MLIRITASPTPLSDPTTSSPLPSSSSTAISRTTPTVPTQTGQAAKSSTPVIVGGTIGGVALIVFAIGAFIFFRILRKYFVRQESVPVERINDDPRRAVTELPSPQTELPTHNFTPEMPGRYEQSNIDD